MWSQRGSHPQPLDKQKKLQEVGADFSEELKITGCNLGAVEMALSASHLKLVYQPTSN